MVQPVRTLRRLPLPDTNTQHREGDGPTTMINEGGNTQWTRPIKITDTRPLDRMADDGCPNFGEKIIPLGVRK